MKKIFFLIMLLSLSAVYAFSDTSVIGISGWDRQQDGIRQNYPDDPVSFGGASLDHQVHIKLRADDNFLIDGRSNPRAMTQGVLRLEHTPAVPGTRPVTIDVDANNQPDTRAITVTYRATGFDSADQGNIYDLIVDTDNATGGLIHALNVDKVGSGTITINGIGVGQGIVPVHQHSVTAETSAEQGWKYDGSYTDTTTAFSSSVTDVAIFSADNDYIYVGHSTVFNSIRVLLNTGASGPGVMPAFSYSVGGGSWTSFAPADGTNGFKINGAISWVQTLSGWATDTVNGVSKYYIRIQRTQNTLQTTPIEDKITVVPSHSYIWDENGDLNIHSVAVDKNIGVAFTNQTTSGGVNTGTLTNSPVSGNPTGWLRITVNGATKYLPVW